MRRLRARRPRRRLGVRAGRKGGRRMWLTLRRAARGRAAPAAWWSCRRRWGEEAGDASGGDVEAEVVDRCDVAEALGEVADRRHAASLRPAAAAVIGRRARPASAERQMLPPRSPPYGGSGLRAGR